MSASSVSFARYEGQRCAASEIDLTLPPKNVSFAERLNFGVITTTLRLPAPAGRYDIAVEPFDCVPYGPGAAARVVGYLKASWRGWRRLRGRRCPRASRGLREITPGGGRFAATILEHF